MEVDLRVPVDRVGVSLTLSDGQRRRGTMFVPPGSGVEELLEQRQAFVPIEEEGKVRLYASGSVACLEVMDGRIDLPELELPLERRRLVVRLKNGEVLDGEIRYVAWRSPPRTADLLNEPTATFALYRNGRVQHVAKMHVECVEEAE